MYHYDFRARAENAGGVSSWDASTFATAPPTPPAPSLATPNASATDQSTDITLDWDAVSDPVSGYEVQWKAANGQWGNAYSATTATTSHAVTGLARSETYDWRVRAENADGNSAWTVGTFLTLPHTPGQVLTQSQTPSATTATDDARTKIET